MGTRGENFVAPVARRPIRKPEAEMIPIAYVPVIVLVAAATLLLLLHDARK